MNLPKPIILFILSALIELGLVLFLVTVVINMVGKRIIKRFTNE